MTSRHRRSIFVWPFGRLARLGYLKRDETSSILSCCLKRDETSSISRDLTVMTVSNRLTGRFLILNGHGQKIMNRDEIKRDENGQNMFDRRCLLVRCWPNAGAQWKTGFSSFSHQVTSRGHSKMELFSWKILSALVTSLDGKNQFSMERVHLPKPGQNLGIANFLFQ